MVWAAAGTVLLALAGLLAALPVVTRFLPPARGGRADRTLLQLKGALLALTASAAILAGCLLAVEGDLAYVRAQVDASVPVLYRFAALWAGQEGSLLFWSLLALLIAVVVDRTLRSAPLDSRIRSLVMAALAALPAFFILLTLVEASPF